MGCNCKRIKAIQDKYGIKLPETYLNKIYRGVWKVGVLVFGAVAGIILVPVVISILIFNQLFRGGKGITIPKKLAKYLV